MLKTRLAAATLSALLIGACANPPYQPMEPGSTQPSASVADTMRFVSGSRWQAFIVQSVDGHRIANSMDASLAASRDQGARLTVEKITRQLPAHAMQITLEGRDVSAMPIAAVLGGLSGRYHAVEGVVAFTPLADRHYAVVGTLGKESSSIWIEDAESHEPATEKVIAK